MKGSCFSIWETDWGNELVEFGRRGYEALGKIHPPIELPRLGATLPKKEYILFFIIIVGKLHTHWVLNSHHTFHAILKGEEVLFEPELIGKYILEYFNKNNKNKEEEEWRRTCS